MQWTTYQFDLFGLSFDIFRDMDLAVLADPRTPDAGHLSQGGWRMGLAVSFGENARFEVWLERIRSDSAVEVSVLEERGPAILCGRPAERTVFAIHPPPPAVGLWFEPPPPGSEPAGPEGPFRLALVGAEHRGTPVIATFRRPLASTAEQIGAEERFFASFRCAP